LTILFSVLHSGQVNWITYPDLVPIISGIAECLIIEVFSLVFLRADEPDLIGRSGPPSKKDFEGWRELRSFALRLRAILVSKPYITSVQLAGECIE
jgi:hypothetical protein